MNPPAVHVMNLAAVHGANPLGFLMGLGLLRLGMTRPKLACDLAWAKEPPHVAAIKVIEEFCRSRDNLVEQVFQGLTNDALAPWPEVALRDQQLKTVTQKDYSNLVQTLASGPRDAFTSLCSDAREDDDSVAESPLVMTSGPQDLPTLVRQLRDEVRQGGAALGDEALFGPWKYRSGHPFGFDPQMELLHAYMASKPEGTAERVPAAILLAVQGMQWLQPYPTQDRRGFALPVFKDPHHGFMRWPLWGTPLSGYAVFSLLSLFDGERGDWSSRGVFAAYESERFRTVPKQGYFVLRSGRRLF